MSRLRMVVVGRASADRDLERTFVTWTFVRAIFHRGYVLASSLYFVLVAHLVAAQLLLLGPAMATSLLVCDIPLGVLADTIGRRWLLVLGHAFLAASMILTSLVTSFPALVVTQLAWGAGWGLSIGTDVAWVTDELRSDRITHVLTSAARGELFGGAIGVVAFGLLGAAAGLRTAVFFSGVGIAPVGVFVATRFTERHFTVKHARRWSTSVAVFRRATRLARGDREIRVVLAATLLVNGAGMVAWLFVRRLAELGFPVDPALWYAGLGIAGFAIGSPVLRLIAARIDTEGAVRKAYALASGVGVLGLGLVAFAPDAALASAGVVIVTAMAFNVMRTVSVIWVNWRSGSDVRATVLSMLSQAETVGEIVAGIALALLAENTGLSGPFMCAAGLIALAGALVMRFGAGPSTTAHPGYPEGA